MNQENLFPDQFLNNVLVDIMESKKGNQVTLPRADYAKVLEMDVLYVNKLRTLLVFQSQKVQALHYQLTHQKMLDEKVKQSIQLKLSELDVKMWKTQTELRVQEKLVQDKQEHFWKYFMPQFQKEIADMKNGWESAYNQCVELAKTPSLLPEIKTIKSHVDRFEKYSKQFEQQPERMEDFKTMVYKDFRAALAEYESKQAKASNVAEKN